MHLKRSHSICLSTVLLHFNFDRLFWKMVFPDLIFRLKCTLCHIFKMLKSLLVYSTCFLFAKTNFILNLSCQRTFHCHNISSEVHYPNHTTSIIRLWKAFSQVGLFLDDPVASEDIRRGCWRESERFRWFLKRITTAFEDIRRRHPKITQLVL